MSNARSHEEICQNLEKAVAAGASEADKNAVRCDLLREPQPRKRLETVMVPGWYHTRAGQPHLEATTPQPQPMLFHLLPVEFCIVQWAESNLSKEEFLRRVNELRNGNYGIDGATINNGLAIAAVHLAAIKKEGEIRDYLNTISDGSEARPYPPKEGNCLRVARASTENYKKLVSALQQGTPLKRDDLGENNWEDCQQLIRAVLVGNRPDYLAQILTPISNPLLTSIGLLLANVLRDILATSANTEESKKSNLTNAFQQLCALLPPLAINFFINVIQNDAELTSLLPSPVLLGMKEREYLRRDLFPIYNKENWQQHWQTVQRLFTLPPEKLLDVMTEIRKAPAGVAQPTLVPQPLPKSAIDPEKTETELEQAVSALKTTCETYQKRYPNTAQTLLDTLATNKRPADKITDFTAAWQQLTNTLAANEKSEKDAYTKQFRKHIVAILVTVLTAGIAAIVIAALGHKKPNAQGKKDLWHFYRKPTEDKTTATLRATVNSKLQNPQSPKK